MANQEGVNSFRDALRPHQDSPSPAPIVELPADSGVVITSLRPSRDGEALMRRLFNTAGETVSPELRFDASVSEVWLSHPMEAELAVLPASIPLGPNEIVTLRLVR